MEGSKGGFFHAFNVLFLEDPVSETKRRGVGSQASFFISSSFSAIPRCFMQVLFRLNILLGAGQRPSFMMMDGVEKYYLS